MSDNVIHLSDSVLLDYMSSSKTKISIWLPNELYSQLQDIGCDTITEAVVRQLEISFVSHCPTQSDGELRSAYDVLNVTLEERNKYISSLKEHNNALQSEVEHLRELHNNYMLQMQTLINQRAIEAPGAKRPWWKIW